LARLRGILVVVCGFGVFIGEGRGGGGLLIKVSYGEAKH